MKESTKYKMCALCDMAKPLMNSHFIPSHSYKKMNNMVKEGYAVMLIDDIGNNSTSKQITQPLLCYECEQLFRSHGEDYYSRNGYWSNDAPPKILDIIVRERQLQDEIKTGLLDLDSEKKLFYFVSSIFWRGAFTWPKYKPIALSQNIKQEMQALLLEQINPKSYQVILIPMYRQNYSISFPLEWKSPDGDVAYFFCIQMLGYLLVSRETFKKIYSIEPELSTIFYQRNDRIVDGYFDYLERKYMASNKRGDMPHDISWLY